MRGLFSASLFLLLSFAVAGNARAETITHGAAVPAKATPGFDGVIDLNISMEAGSGDLQLFKSGDRAKLDMKLLVNPLPAPIQLGVLLDPKQPDFLFLVNDNLRTYSSIAVAATAPVSDTAFAGKYTLKVLGKEKLLGYECTHLTLTRHRELVDAWISQDFPDVYAVLKKLQEANPQFGQAAAFRALEDAGKAGLPMRCIVVRDGERVTTEVRRIERKALPAALFTVPREYKKSDLTATQGLQPTPEQVEEMKKIIQGALEGK
ncbi:MAG: hypothetical protein JWO30_4891 [Fibrobacteres bacterium]|nr:hypothetical protein [Fibrobacterota bacterium]